MGVITLPEFLLARIAEDERRVEFVRDFIPEHGDQGEYIDPARVLAECDAKRRIVEMQATNDEDRHLPGFHYKAQMIERVLHALALPYADHPDYREEWRP